MRKSERNKTTSSPMFLKRFLPIVIHLLIFQATANLAAETVQNTIAQAPSPSIEAIEKPHSTYRLGDEILYRIRIRWLQLTDDIRMGSPDLETDNLELVAVSQETASDADQNRLPGSVEQILTFRFRARQPGRAAVNRLSLKWVGHSGSAVQSLSVPRSEFNIIGSANQGLRLAFITGAGITGLFAFLFAFYLRRKKKPVTPSPQAKSHEEQTLEELKAVQNMWESNGNHRDFLDHLKKTLQGYLRLKLDWNPVRDDYNALRERTEGKWSKKDARELIELFQKIECEQFSGNPPEGEKLLNLYQAIFSFIEQKRVISNVSEESWIQRSSR